MNKTASAPGLVFLLVAVFAAAGLSRAEIPRLAPAHQDTLEAALDRIQTHASGDAWKKGGFQDEAIEAWLDKLVGKVAKAADFPELALPVRLKDVRPANPPAGPLQSALIIGDDVNLANVPVRNSIILATGSVQANRVDKSVIVARGAIQISASSANSVIVSGVYIRLGQYDGQPMNTTNGSLAVSRGWVDMGTGYGTLILAPEGINSGRTESCTFVNAPVPQPPVRPGIPVLGRDRGSRSVKAPDVPLEAVPAHPLTERIEIVGILHGERQEPELRGRSRSVFGPTGIVFRFGDRTQVAEVGQPIVDEDGNPLEGLRNWKLACVNAKMALLTSRGANAVLRLDKK